MTDSKTITCPECDTDQPKTAPFCQNCGFRMRSPKTVQEPMMALTPERVEAIEAASDDGPAKAANPAEEPAPLTADTTQGRPARKVVGGTGGTGGSDEPNKPNKSAEQGDSPPSRQKSPDTLVEGVRAISRDEPLGDEPPETSSDTLSPQTSEEDEVASTPRRQTARIPIDHRRGQIRLVVGATLIACVAIVAGLSWFHIERQSASEQVTSPGGQAHIIDIEAGHFRRGLAEDAESFILEFCHRYYDDVERECDRDRLLAGEFPEQTVNMPAYGIDALPVRNKDYQGCVDAGGCEAVDFSDCDVWTPKGLQIGVRVPRVLRRDDHPVVCVDRQQARSYCQFHDGELPSHNQWEKAARGDRSSLFPWGDQWQPDRANWGETDIMRTSVAGKLDGYAWTSPPGAFVDGQSPYGVYDMAGNVAEWVRGSDPMEGHVRGGSWISNPFELRSTARKSMDATATRTDVGFRCVY